MIVAALECRLWWTPDGEVPLKLIVWFGLEYLV